MPAPARRVFLPGRVCRPHAGGRVDDAASVQSVGGIAAGLDAKSAFDRGQPMHRAVVRANRAGLLGIGVLVFINSYLLQSGETTAQLKILKAPFIYGMALLCAFTGLVHLSLMFSEDSEEGEGGVL